MHRKCISKPLLYLEAAQSPSHVPLPLNMFSIYKANKRTGFAKVVEEEDTAYRMWRRLFFCEASQQLIRLAMSEFVLYVKAKHAMEIDSTGILGW